MAQKFDVRIDVTQKMIAAIEAGTLPWRKPWTGSAIGGAFPLRSTGEQYRGINVLLLWLAAEERGYCSAHWFTYRQASELGAQVRKGEKASTVVKYGTIERENDQGEDKKIPYTKAYRVFNADQIDGLPEAFYRQPEPPRDLGTLPDPALDSFFASFGVPIDTTDKPQAFYNPQSDRIHMPPISTFYEAVEFYGTLAHECAHATGHKSRLNRFQKFQDRKAYAFEELVAEITSCMLAAELGFKPDFGQSAAYVENWLKALNDDKGFIFKAASEAQKAVDCIKSNLSETTAEAHKMTMHLICSRCGSDNVRADAYAAWDSEQADWVLHSVYDARICENCEGPTTLLEIDEETELEIGFYGMINDSGGARLIEDHEMPDFFDVVVRTTAITSGDILTLFEFEDQSRKDANASLAGLTVLFPKAPIDWHLGKDAELIPSGGSSYCRVSREQWEAHKASAPDVAGRDWVFCRFYEGSRSGPLPLPFEHR